MASFFFQVLLLFAFWTAMSGILDFFHLAAGLLSALFVTYWTRRGNPKNANTPSLLEILGYFFKSILYGFWLLGQIIQAALHVSKLILRPKLIITPQFIAHKTILKGDEAKTIFANSITLTPGTITVDIEDGHYTIHEIDALSSEGIRTGEMEKHINKIFGIKDDGSQ